MVTALWSNGKLGYDQKAINRIRILVAKPSIDGHDRGALVLAKAFRDVGMEVIYSGLFATPEQVAQMAIDEDVDVVALSLLNGAHLTAFPKVVSELRKRSSPEQKRIIVVGGGVIPESDKSRLEKLGIIGNFGPGTPIKVIIDFIIEAVKKGDKSVLKRAKRVSPVNKNKPTTTKKGIRDS